MSNNYYIKYGLHLQGVILDQVVNRVSISAVVC